MIICLVLIGAFVVWLAAGFIKDNDDWKLGAYICGGCIAVTLLAVLFVFRLSTPGEIREFRAVQQTLTDARGNTDISSIELAAIQTEVIKANCWLASTQFYAKNPWTNWFIPSSVLDLKPVK